jgi:phage replication-related protein YjqB (UPF0714/DUF867 family)
VKLGSSYVRLSNAKAGSAVINEWRSRRRLPFVVAAACACVLLVAVQANSDYYQCYQSGGGCTGRALAGDAYCLEGATLDYDVTAPDNGSQVTVLSFHGGNIEANTSRISEEVERRFAWNRYDFDAHARPSCEAEVAGGYDGNKLHITATGFNHSRAVSLVGAHPKAVAIHGYKIERQYERGVMCVGGKDDAARNSFISHVRNNAALWDTPTNPNRYPLDPVDATTAAAGTKCSDLRGFEGDNLVNRTSTGRGLQLELHRDFRADLVNTSSSYNTLRDIFYGAVYQAMVGAAGCVTVDNPGTTWQNRALNANQTGTFNAEVDAIPLGSDVDAGVGLSNGPQTSYAGLACSVRFYGGRIEARNGNTYGSLSPLTYSPNTSYHFRFDVNVPAHTYSVYVTPTGGAEQLVGRDYAFRNEQATVSSLNNWSLFSDAGSMQSCGFGAPCYTATPAGGWVNNPFAAQTGAFTAEWDASPSTNPVDAVMGLSNGAQTTFPGFACLVRFYQGRIEARDGGVYRAASLITHEPNKIYHFRLVVNVPAHTYSVYVTPAGGAEQVVGLNYAFRTEQSTVGSLSNYGLRTDGATGSVRLCNFRIGTDRFGVTMLNPTVPGGREWFSKWDNGHVRSIPFGPDSDDPEFHARGQASYTVNGQGVLTASGPYVRMYVYDPAFQDNSVYSPSQFASWNNVEVTVYFMRLSDANVTYSGVVAGAKIRHIPDEQLCGTRGYYGRMRNDGRVDFEKEINHRTPPQEPETEARPREGSLWPALPSNVWIGYKYVIRDVDGGTHVKLELWRDMTDGANGGSWEKVHEYVDAGGWGAGLIPCAAGVDPAQILTGPNLSVLIRNDSATDVRYKKWSIREIAAQ